MKSNSILERILLDDDSLILYKNSQHIDFDSVKRHLLLLERKSNRNIPDHYYKMKMSENMSGINTLEELLTKGIYKISSAYLEVHNSHVYVIPEKLNDWQQLITKIPPLLLIANQLYYKEGFLIKGLDTNSQSDIQRYFLDIIKRNVRYSALPSPYLKEMEYLKKQYNGFHDLHIHLNGSAETDIVWQDFLKNPDKVYGEMVDGFKDEMVKQQFEQESSLLTPKIFNDILNTSRANRQWLCEFITGTVSESDPSSNDFVNLLSILNNDTPYFSLQAAHPLSVIFNIAEEENLLALECLFYMLIFHYLETNADLSTESVARIFHYYLLSLGLVNRFLVQQTHQYGFTQFQKLTSNEFRSLSEKGYKNRFFQLMGNNLDHMSYIEGRFSPKNITDKNQELITKILSGWNDLLKNPKITSEKELVLIAHFIKEPERAYDDKFRFRKLRSAIWEKAKCLAGIKRNGFSYSNRIVGIDAAASEFDTPPEVFAPYFRYLRRNGISNMTFHAGEDFFHIVGGLRAIYESIQFLELQRGDRIGHGTACGISVSQWVDNIGTEIYMKKGEVLDDLIFVYDLITTENIQSLQLYLPSLHIQIERLCSEIYSNFFTVNQLIEAWRLRKYCPTIVLSETKDVAATLDLSDIEEWEVCRRQNNISRIIDDVHVKKILQMYHEKDTRKEYDRVVRIGVFDYLSADAIQTLQLAILKVMHSKGIVLETLPTSNIRIGHHHNFDTYHLWNWHEWAKVHKYSIPPIIVGTDDAGIFATNIYNEYCNIYCNLVYKQGKPINEVLDFIQELNINSMIYRFQMIPDKETI